MCKSVVRLGWTKITRPESAGRNGAIKNQQWTEEFRKYSRVNQADVDRSATIYYNSGYIIF